MTKCLRCNGEMVRHDKALGGVITRFCSECGLIENYFSDQVRVELLKKAKRAEGEND